MINNVRIKFNEIVWHDQPYTHPQLGSIIQRDFFNREQEKERIQHLLSLGIHRIIAIVGERRSGKSSMLKCMTQRLSTDPAQLFLPVLIPWQGVQSRDTLTDEILYGIRAQILKSRPHSVIAQLDQTPMTDSACVEQINELLAYIPGQQLLLCIDELDSLIEEATPQERLRLLQLVEAIAEATTLPLTMLITMTSESSRLHSLSSSPFLTQAIRLQLHPFSRADFAEMVQELAGAEDALSEWELEQMYMFSGGWPYFAKLLLVSLAMVARGTNRLVQALALAVQNPHLADTMQNLYTMHFNDHEKVFLLLLASFSGHIDANSLADSSSINHSVAQTLMRRDFVLEHEAASYSFRIALLYEWFRCWPQFAEEVARCLPHIQELREPGYGHASLSSYSAY